MKTQIKVAFCAAYDWYLLKHSLPLVYKDADLICIAIDKDRISWSGKPYLIDEAAFAAFLKEIDTDGKIRLYEDDFHREELGPMQNEVRQRNLMAEAMGKGGWHIQLDSDEYFIDFAGFVSFLKTHKYNRNINIVCPSLTLFKKVEDGYLLIEHKAAEQTDVFTIATNNPLYEHGRKNGYFNIRTNFPFVHQSWARDETEIEQKINNWGHSADFDVQTFLDRWKSLNGDNYQGLINFHPLVPEVWPEIMKVEAESIEELIQFFRQHPLVHFSPGYLRKANSIWLSRYKSLLKKLG